MNVFTGRTKSELESWLRATQNEIATGKTIVKTDIDGVSTEAQINMSAQMRLRLILRALNALDPTSYPIKDVRRINRVQARIR